MEVSCAGAATQHALDRDTIVYVLEYVVACGQAEEETAQARWEEERLRGDSLLGIGVRGADRQECIHSAPQPGQTCHVALATSMLLFILISSRVWLVGVAGGWVWLWHLWAAIAPGPRPLPRVSLNEALHGTTAAAAAAAAYIANQIGRSRVVCWGCCWTDCSESVRSRSG